jgi:hypothetical protein
MEGLPFLDSSMPSSSSFSESSNSFQTGPYIYSVNLGHLKTPEVRYQYVMYRLIDHV